MGGSNGTDWEQFKNVSNIIINCGNYETVSSSGNYCGGITGFLKGDIQNCCNKNEITNSGNLAGGISGSIAGKIQNCYNMCNISGQDQIGGISGDQTLGDTINCYSLGEINGTGETVGNIVGGNMKKYITVIQKMTHLQLRT